MANVPQYIQSFIPDSSYSVLGKRLQPLSLGHLILMMKHGCSFAYAEEADIYDLILGATICSMTYNDFVKCLNDDTITIKEKRWKYVGRSVKKERPFIRWMKDWGISVAKSKVNILYETISFSHYIQEGCKLPQYWKRQNVDDNQTGAHWIQTIFLTCTSQLNYTQEEVLNTPLTKVYYDCFAYAAGQGKIQLRSEEEIAEIEHLKEQTNGRNSPN